MKIMGFIYGSIGVFLTNALHLVQTEPIICLCHLSKAHNQLVRLLCHLAGLSQDQTLCLRHREDPIFSFVVVDTDLERSVEEARCDFIGRELSDVLEGNVYPKL